MAADPSAAVAASAKRKIKRASGLLRDATRELAAAETGDAASSILVCDRATEAQARDLIAVTRARHGAADVIVVPRPARS